MTLQVAPGRTIAVVVTYQSEDVVGGLLASLAEAFDGADHQVVVVDNDSSDGTVDAVRNAAPEARVVQMGRNAGYAAAINRVLGDVGPDDALLILNPDVRLAPASVGKLRAALDQPGTGVAVPLLTGEDGATSFSLRRRPTVLRALGEALLGGGRAGRMSALGEVVTDERAYERPAVVDWATGAVLLVSGRCLSAVGPWDESYFLYSEETDFLLRTRDAGFVTRFVPAARAVHVGGEAMTSTALYPLLTINRLRLYRRRHGLASSVLFAGAVLLNEALRASSQPHSAALRALVSRRARRRALAPLAAGAKAQYICFSAQDWWYHNRAHSDFQLMRRIARTRRVLFVNSIGLRMPSTTGSAPPLRRILRKARSVSKLVRRPDPAAPGFMVMTPLVVPLYERPLVRRFNAAFVRAQVRLVAAATGVGSPAIMVTIPTAVDVIEGMERRSLLFNRSDKHSEYGEADGALIQSMEERLLHSADHVLYVSRELMQEDAGHVDDRAVFLDHGVDLHHFRRRPADELPVDLADLPQPRIGFFGGLDDYVVDFDLLVRVAEAFPDASVVLIGDAGSPMDRFSRLTNLHWLGYRPYEDIPAYGSGFDVALMPWLQNDWIRFCNPIKMKEYLALGLPIVSMEYPEGHCYDGLVRWARTADKFVEQVRLSLEDGGLSTPEERRRAVAGESWDSRAERLIELAEGR